MELDGFVCRQCKRGEPDEVVLQVHHIHYSPGKAPWDYDYRDCETLCKGCHASVHGHIRPKFGWDFLHEEDLGDLTGTCELCGTDIRYVFWIQHPHWEPIGVGTVCCDHLTGTEIASERMRFYSRMGRFVESRRWKPSVTGIKMVQKGITLEIVPDPGGFRLIMNGKVGRGIYPAERDAKQKAFEGIENGSAIRYLTKQGLIPPK